MTGSTFTVAEERELVRLLDKVATNSGFWPSEAAMRAAHGAASMWAPELVIFRRAWRQREVLLRVYEEGAEAFLGMWHLPGGYNRWPELDIQATCSRIAKREIGVDVVFKGTLFAYKWRPGEHPYGRPLSLYVECQPVSDIEITGKSRFFPLNKLPENMVVPHKWFLETL